MTLMMKITSCLIKKNNGFRNDLYPCCVLSWSNSLFVASKLHLKNFLQVQTAVKTSVFSEVNTRISSVMTHTQPSLSHTDLFSLIKKYLK